MRSKRSRCRKRRPMASTSMTKRKTTGWSAACAASGGGGDDEDDRGAARVSATSCHGAAAGIGRKREEGEEAGERRPDREDGRQIKFSDDSEVR